MKDEFSSDQGDVAGLQEIVLVCLQCGTQHHTGQYSRIKSFDEAVIYSHGYCSMNCAEKQYPGIIELSETCRK
jgi:hypothetical protein